MHAKKIKKEEKEKGKEECMRLERAIRKTKRMRLKLHKNIR